MFEKCTYETLSDDALKKAVEKSSESVKSKVFAANKLASWFEIDFSIKIFGVTIVRFHFPPQEEKADN